jgi:hypothetical protein
MRFRWPRGKPPAVAFAPKKCRETRARLFQSVANTLARLLFLLTLRTRRERIAPESLTWPESAFVHRKMLGARSIQRYRL